MWDDQDGVPKGERPIKLNTAYSIELNASSYIKSWKKDIRIMLEEDAMFTERGVQYLHGRQKSFILVGNGISKGNSLDFGCEN